MLPEAIRKDLGVRQLATSRDEALLLDFSVPLGEASLLRNFALVLGTSLKTGVRSLRVSPPSADCFVSFWLLASLRRYRTPRMMQKLATAALVG